MPKQIVNHKEASLSCLHCFASL